jgi:tetratricopeptide (TPR) repeat protein
MKILKTCSLKTRVLRLILASAVIFLAPGPAPAQTTGDQELFLVAQKAFDDGFHDVSLRYLDQLLKDYPQTGYRVRINLLAGQCYFFKSQYLKAYEAFQKNLDFDELKDATFFWLGETYLKGADYRQAERHFRELLDNYPDSEYLPHTYYSMGWLYFERQEFLKAKEFFTRLVREFPEHALSEDATFKTGEMEFNLRQYQEAIDVFQRYQYSYPGSRRAADANFYLAESNYYLEDYLTAVSYYAKTAEQARDPNLVLMAKVSLGWCYVKLGKFDIARERFEEARRDAEEMGIVSDDIYLGLATLYSETADYPKALEAFDRILTLFSESQRAAEAHLGKANIYYQTRQFAEAVLAYQTLIDKFGSSPEHSGTVEKAYFGLAWSYLKSGNVAAAVKFFEAVRDRSDNETVKISALTQIGDAWQDAENYPKALEIYDRILTGHPDSAYTDYVQYRQGVAFLKMGQVDAATMSFQILENNFPDSPYIQDKNYYLAVAYFKKGDWQLARHQALDFLEKGPENNQFIAEANYILGQSLFNLKDYPRAISVFQKITRQYASQTSVLHSAEIGIAKAHYRDQNTNEALKKFRQILVKYPDTEIAEESLIWLGDHYAQIADIDQAISHYREFVKLFPGSRQISVIRFQLAQAHEAKGDYDRAIELYKSITPESDRILNARARLAIAGIFSISLDPESALETYNSIIAGSPEFQRDAYLKIAGIHKNTRDYHGALATYQKALQAGQGLSEVNDAQLYFQIADVYDLMSQSRKAVDEYLKVAYLFPDQSQWVARAYLRAARIFEDGEEWEEAGKIYQKVLELGRDESKYAQERLDWIMDKIGAFPAAPSGARR